MWTVEIVYDGGKTRTVKARSKYDAKQKRNHFLNQPDVIDAYVFEGDDYIDETEL